MSIEKMFGLKGKTAVVTGASQWLGFDIASVFAEAGAAVIVSSRDLLKAEETAAGLAKVYDVETKGLKLELKDHASIVAFFEVARAWKGGIDVLVNNAGGGSGKSLGNILLRAPEDEESMLKINLLGVLFCCQEAAKIMSAQKGGSIINIASMAGLVGRDRRMYEKSGMKGQPVDYAAAKAGVIGLSRDLAAALGPYGVRVNSISPGGFEKPGDLPERFLKDYANGTMLGRWGKMGTDIKGAALFLASAASDYVTGHNLVVDGGFSLLK